ncbi:MAG: DUF2281 domain-containing protein [Candidatus Latescibacteria bacterium]|nr:DUF2281 domain-containing protein [Candidatus Latescibacterota bacterium]
MTAYETAISKLQRLPEPLVQEVNDFIEFLLVKQDETRWQLWTHFRENADLTESDLPDYLHSLESYEDSLVRGEARW